MSKSAIKQSEGMNNTNEASILSLMDKVERTESIYIGYPRFDSMLKKIEFCHQFSKVSAEPDCLLVTGPTGAGKTTLLKQYVQSHPVEVLPTKTKVPILWATIPSPATHKSVVQKLLYELGDPSADTGNSTSALTIRLNRFIKDCEVELIIMDELQHFIDRDSQKVLKTVSDWLKTLLIDTKVPIILLGMPESEEVISSNPQLSRRFAHRFILQPFGFKTPSEVEEFRKFLFAVDSQLPLCDRSNLAAVDMAARIFYATDGVVGHVMKLIRKATYIALDWGRQKLDLDVLAEGFDLHILGDKPEKINPFSADIFSLEEVQRLGVENKRVVKPLGATNKRMKAKKPPKQRFSDVM